jgi:hypothetical protein
MCLRAYVNQGKFRITIIYTPLELVHQKRDAFRPPPLVADRVLDLDFIEHGTVVESDEERVADGSSTGIVVLGAKALLFNAEDLGAERVDAGVGGGGISALMPHVRSPDEYALRR